jgi:protein-tyrosine phosphatase
VIDLHSHVLHDLDDGPETLGQAVAIVRAMAADGVTAVAATPHVRDDWPDVTPERRDARLRELREALAGEGVPVDVLAGGEIALDALPLLTAAERARYGLGGNPRLLLLEFPYWGWPLGLADTVFRLQLEGVTALIAHPERNRDVQDDPERLEPVVRAGGLVQLTAASVDGRLGRAAEQTSRRLLERGLAHVIASDAHTPDVRAAGLARAARAVGEELGRWLTRDVPGALVAGEPLPARPDTGGRRLRRRRG